MKVSNFFLPTLKEKPQDAHIPSHVLMLRAGLIMQAAAGIYSWLPLGLRVMKKVENITRYYLNKVGCLEILMPCIQPSHLWLESGRIDSYGKEMLKINDRHENQLVFSPTGEELVTDIFRAHIKSYKDLPKNLYHIQWKFRDEIRPRFGVMRSREFLMKDGYSFDIDETESRKSYYLMYKTYLDIFHSMGLNVIPVKANSGAIGGNLNHEFHILSEVGENLIYYDEKWSQILSKDTINYDKYLNSNLYAVAEEEHNESNNNEAIIKGRSIEVGHIFYFSTKYSESMKAYVSGYSGQMPVHMGSYGIGISRLIGALIEVNNDANGIIWPQDIAPFLVSIINLKKHDTEACSIADNIYSKLLEHNVEVLYDDTDQRSGSKLVIHDLIGIPWQVIIGSKIKQGIIEFKNRSTKKIIDLTIDTVIDYIISLNSKVNKYVV